LPVKGSYSWDRSSSRADDRTNNEPPICAGGMLPDVGTEEKGAGAFRVNYPLDIHVVGGRGTTLMMESEC
jgi:hypothetical protein